MNLENKTKKQLIDLLNSNKTLIKDVMEKQKGFRKELDKSWRNIVDLENEKIDLQNQLLELKLSNLADIKTFNDHLIVFSHDQMTHREKKYLCGKLIQIFKQKISDVKSDIRLDFEKAFPDKTELPF